MSTLVNTLKQLRLSGLLQTLDVRLQEAAANRLGHASAIEEGQVTISRSAGTITFWAQFMLVRHESPGFVPLSVTSFAL
jgi:hypothetical protein